MSMREFVRKCQFPMLLAWGTYPLAACIAAFAAPALLSYMWLFPVYYWVLGTVMLLLPSKPRLLLSGVGAVLMLLPGMLWLKSAEQAAVLVAALIYCGLLFWSVQLPGWEPGREIGAGWIGVCIGITFVGYFIASFEERMTPATAGIRLSLYVFMFFAMLSMNRGSLNLAAGESRGFTAVMRRKNLLLTVGMFGIALAAALIPSLFGLVKMIVGWIGWLIAWLRELFAAMVPLETTVETTTGATTMPLPSGEAWMDVVLEGKDFAKNTAVTDFMMTAIVLIVVVPFSIAAVYKLVRFTIKGVRRLVELIDRVANAPEEDFVDEITDTRDDMLERVEEKEKTARKIVRAATGKLPPGERIRDRYRRLQNKHPEWTQQSTARENLNEEAAKLYERARYSDHPITEADADRFRSEIEKPI